MAIEIVGNSEDVARYRKFLHEKGVYTKHFLEAAKRSGQTIRPKPEGYRVINGGIKSVFNVEEKNGVNRITKGLDPDQKLYLKGVANANMMDRMDERLEPAGVDVENYMKNPVLLLDHLYMASATIGRVTNLDPQDSGLNFEAYIGDPQKAPMTQQQKDVRSLVAQNLLQTVSVGFIPKKVKAPVFDGEGKLEECAVILNWEMLELSVVAIPANAGSVFEIGNLAVSSNDENNQKKRIFTGFGEKDKMKKDLDPGECKDNSETETTKAGEEREMEEKLVEMIEEMKRIGTLLSGMNEKLESLEMQNTKLTEMLLEDYEEEEKTAEEDDKEEEKEYDKDKEKEDDEDDKDEKQLETDVSDLKNLVKDQGEKMEQISAIMLQFIKGETIG